MKRTFALKVVTAAVAAAALSMSAYAGETTMKKGEPASVDESRPDMTGKDAKGKAGVATMPGKGLPASTDESRTGQAGKPPPKGVSKNDKNMANPKTPASVSESKPDSTAREGSQDKTYPKKKGMDKDGMAKDGMAKDGMAKDGMTK